MKRKALLFALFIMAALLLGTSSASSSALRPEAPLPKPEDINCAGRERDTVFVRWTDTATDETNYRVERSVAGGAWTEVATVTPNAQGKYEPYIDTGIPNPTTYDKRYRMRSYRASDTSYSPYSDICNNRRFIESGSYRVFYGVRGLDDCPQVDSHDICVANVSSGGVNSHANFVNNTANASAAAFSRLGFVNGASPPGSLDKAPVGIAWCDGGGCAGDGGVGLGVSLIETAFDTTTRAGDPIAWVVTLHELFHYQQFRYWGLNDPYSNWVVEGQARSIQDKICIGGTRSTAECFDDIATGYAGYVPEVNGYLADTNRTLIQLSYPTALFWTYVIEKYGTSSPTDAVEAGMNLMVKFWEQSRDNPWRDGVAVLNSALSDLGHTESFRDIWKDFAVANYAKNLKGAGVPAKYQYADMSQTGGNYNAVSLSLSHTLKPDEPAVDSDETVLAWAAKYYELQPTSKVPVIDLRIRQDTTNMVYYTVLGIKGTNLAYEYNLEARHLNHTFPNNNYDKVVVIVAGLENMAHYRYFFYGTQPKVVIRHPTTSNVARVGNPSSPDKFRVVVDLLAADGTPLTGTDLNSFSFQVGDQDVPTGNILAKATLMRQHWFVLRAPGQSSATYYDLTVSYDVTMTDTQSNAVYYVPRTDADNVLLVDRSGSMAGTKLDAAKQAARLFVDSWRTGDKIGVISFDHNVTTNMQLTDWTDWPSGGSRQTAFTAINSLTYGGGTNIGDALRAGWDELKARGNTVHDWAMVLLSDGKEEFSSPVETFDTMISNLADTTEKQPAVHTVAIGVGADRLRMQRLALKTGGMYQYVSAPTTLFTTFGPVTDSEFELNLDHRYRLIATDVIGQQQFYSLYGPLWDGDPFKDIVTIPVENGAAELVLSLSWEIGSPLGQIILTDPDAQVVAIFQSDTRHIVWRVTTPKGGDWTLTINWQGPTNQAAEAPQQEYLPDYLVQASLTSDVTLDVVLPTPLEDRTPGVAMPVIATLTDTGPITGANVIAVIENPNGALFFLGLLDDGAHSDGAENDGVYANTFYQTGYSGSYNVSVYAYGNSTLAGNFTRQETLAFHLHSDIDGDGNEDDNDDTDGDGLPNLWEIHYGTNPNVPDANEDPDGDGKTNGDERDAGTDPLNPDTDNGGESDGTDGNPLDPSDDAVEPTWAVTYPGIGKIYLKYAMREEYVVVGIFRGDNIVGPFTFYDQDTPVDGIFTDNNVTNGQTYCYVVKGQDSDGHQSAPLMPTCTTPKDDPYPPHGGVVINDGASSTSSTNVTLTLYASDDVDPASVAPGEEVFLPPADSATGVTEMLIGNSPDLSDGAWEPYNSSKPWTLAQTSGLATVYVKYRDAADNESQVYAATIFVEGGPGPGPDGKIIYLPIVYR